MAEYIDIHFVHYPDEPAEIWFTDDRGTPIDSTAAFMVIVDERVEYEGGESKTIRIQHNDIERL